MGHAQKGPEANFQTFIQYLSNSTPSKLTQGLTSPKLWRRRENFQNSGPSYDDFQGIFKKLEIGELEHYTQP